MCGEGVGVFLQFLIAQKCKRQVNLPATVFGVLNYSGFSSYTIIFTNFKKILFLKL